MSKPTLSVDFDGVLHSYSSGWKGADVIPDPPVPGALQFLKDASEHFAVAIFSSRTHQTGGLAAMKKWLMKAVLDWDQGDGEPWFANIQWPETKPAAFLAIDDRAICFDGVWPDPKALLGFKPWNKRPALDTALDVSFKVAIMPSGDLGRLRLTKDGAEMIFTKEQARSLANEIVRSLGDGDGA